MFDDPGIFGESKCKTNEELKAGVPVNHAEHQQAEVEYSHVDTGRMQKLQGSDDITNKSQLIPTHGQF